MRLLWYSVVRTVRQWSPAQDRSGPGPIPKIYSLAECFRRVLISPYHGSNGAPITCSVCPDATCLSYGDAIKMRPTLISVNEYDMIAIWPMYKLILRCYNEGEVCYLSDARDEEKSMVFQYMVR
jgi:hypothetical protein